MDYAAFLIHARLGCGAAAGESFTDVEGSLPVAGKGSVGAA